MTPFEYAPPAKDAPTHWIAMRKFGHFEAFDVCRGAFPDGNSALMLVAARLGHIASTKSGKRSYLWTETLLKPAKQEAAA